MSDMDTPLDFTPPIFCSKRKEGCTRLFMCGGPFPMTPRRIVEQVRNGGWDAVQGNTPTTWTFTCAEHATPRG